jgi:hypothetical protein
VTSSAFVYSQMGTAVISAGSTRRVPEVSRGALYRPCTPRTRSSLAFGALPDRVEAAPRAGVARAGAADPMP